MDARHGNKDLQNFLGWSGGQSRCGGGLRQNLTLMSMWLMHQQIFSATLSILYELARTTTIDQNGHPPRNQQQ